MNDNIPRRNDTARMVSAELAIRTAMMLVESMGAAPALTDAIDHLEEARRCVGDFVDAKDGSG